MPQPEKARGPRLYACSRVLLSWPVLALGLVVWVILIIDTAAAATLAEVRIGNHGDYIRIVFEFSGQVDYQLDDDRDAGKISIRFLAANTSIPENLEMMQSSCLERLYTLQQDDHLVASLRFNKAWRKLNPFTLREPARMVLDVFCDAGDSLDQPRTEPQPDPAAQAPDMTSETDTEAPDSISRLTDAPEVETEKAPRVTEEPPIIESTTPSAQETESRIQESKPKTDETAARDVITAVAPQRKDPFQKYLLILLVAITGVIILLIVLIVIQKKRQSAGPDAVQDNAIAEPDETVRVIDSQIKAKLMKYDEQ